MSTERAANLEQEYREGLARRRAEQEAVTKADRDAAVAVEALNAAIESTPTRTDPAASGGLSADERKDRNDALKEYNDLLADQRRELRAIHLGEPGEFANELEEGEERIRDLFATIKGVAPEAIDQMVAQWKAAQGEIRAETERTSRKIKIDLGEQIAKGYGAAIDGFLRGTRQSLDVLEVLKDVGIATVSEMFSKMLADKLDFDLELEANFLDDIPSMLGDAAKKGADAFGTLFDSLGGENQIGAAVAAEVEVQADATGGGLRGFFDSLTDNFRSFFSKAGELAKSFGSSLASGFRNVFGGILGGLGQIGSGIISIFSSIISAAGSALASIGGGILGGLGAIFGFAEGAIVTGPTLAVVGDNASGTEAIVPLERFGEIFGSTGGGGGNVYVNVATREPLNVNQRNEGLDTILEITDDSAEARVVDSITGGGAIHRAISLAFGQGRTPGT